MWLSAKSFNLRPPLKLTNGYLQCNKYQTTLYTLALDLGKAYDMVWRNRVLHVMQTWVINEKIHTFLDNFLTIRSIQVKAYNNLSNLYPTENGLLRELVLSVTLFLIAINDICLQIFTLVYAIKWICISLSKKKLSFKKHLHGYGT